MRKKYALLMLPLAVGSSSMAQITITSADNVPAVGDGFTYNTAAYAPPPAGGENVAFDHSGLVSTGTTQIDWIDPADYSNAAAFPSATLAAVLGSDTLVYELSANGLERVGEQKRVTVPVYGSIDLKIAHSNPMLELELPLTHGDTWTDQVQGILVSDGSSGPRNGVFQGTADGYGSLQLPGLDPVPVLRVHTLLQETINVPINNSPTDVSHKHRQYDYYVPWQKAPVMSIYTDTITVFSIPLANNGIRYMSAASVGLVENRTLPMEMGLWPNPAAEMVYVDMDRPVSEGATLQVSDASGRVLSHVNMASGTRRWQLATEELTSGLYIVTVTDRNGLHGSARLVKR